MAKPAVSDLTLGFYEALGWFTEKDEANDWALLKFCAAWVGMLDPVYELAREREGRDAWAILLDPDNCPAKGLPYLAQYVGVILTADMTEAQQRAEIKHPTGWRRGELESIVLAAQRTLTGTKRVIVHPRTPEIGSHYIRTLATETPSEERTREVLRAALPAWEKLDYEALTGVTVGDLEAGWPESVAELEGAFTDLADIEDTTPAELP